MNWMDIVKLIMKATGKGYAESAQILDKAIQPQVVEARIRQIEWFIGTLEHNSYSDTINLAEIQIKELKRLQAQAKVPKGLTGRIHSIDYGWSTTKTNDEAQAKE